MRKTESSATLFRKITDAVAEGIRITHVVHGALQSHTHHAALLAHSLKGGCQFYLACLVASLVSFLDIVFQL